MFRALSSALAAVLLFCGAVSAQDIQQANGSAPFWVLRGQDGPATLDYDFQNGRYYQAGLAAGSGPSQLLTMFRASSNTNLLPTSASGFAYSTFANNVPRITSGLGLLVEEIRTNLLLNSTVPATQTTGSLANATYTLWVNGAGSATMSAGTATGCGTGVATQGSPVNFTTSGAAGTCTVTVSGALNAFQLEAGAFGTSLIVTAGATVARAADSIVAAKPPVVGPAYTQFAKGTPNAPTTFGTAQNLLQADTGAVGQRVLIRRQNATGGLLVTMVGGSGSAFTPSGTWAQGASGKVAAAAAAGSQAASFNGGTIASNTGATMPTTPTVLRIGSSSGTTEFWNGYVERVALWAVPRLSSADMQRISGP